MSPVVKKCPTCKGKGYKWDPSIWGMTIGAPMIWLIERDEPPGVAKFKNKCRKCDGEGFLMFR